MSWLGKILTFLVLIGAVVWAYFTVAVYVTRTNWKTRADAYEKAFKESEANRQKERRDFEANREALVRMYKTEQGRADDLAKGYETLSDASRKDDATYKQLLANYTDLDAQSKIHAANLMKMQDELADTRKRNNQLEDDRTKLVLAKEAADRARITAENETRRQRTIADEYAKKIETLTSQVAELRQTGGGGGTSVVNRAIDKVPAPLPENIRGTVLRDMVDNFVHISIGIDAGLEPGSRLDVYRESGGGKYLGTLVVTKSIYPKEAVAEFHPARPVAISQLRPDELPRKGDLVGQLTNPTSGSR